MTDRVKLLLCRLFRVPPRPEPPPGDGGTATIFLAGKNYFRYKLILWAFTHVTVFISLAVMFLIMAAKAPEDSMFRTILAVVVTALAAAFLVEMILSFFVLRLDFEMRWYIVTSRSLRIREGILSVREMTITFANIQNMTVQRGPVQRLLGLADLAVSTAGGGGSDPHGGKGVGQSAHVGLFRGVDNVEEIRRVVERGVRAQRGAGLGDPDDDQSSEETVEAIAAAASLLEEVRALRMELTGRA